MTIRHLEIFIAVADCGTMRAAAASLYISQPSVSQAIRELEEYYDIRLFERLNQRIYITDCGKKLLAYARHIVASVEECELALKNEKEHPVIRIGSSVSVGTVLLEDYLKRFEQIQPDADVRITINNTTEIEKKILSNELDLAIVEGSVQSEEVNTIVVDHDELFMVVGRPHPFYKNPKISLQMLDKQALISREEGSMDRNQFEQVLKDADVHMVKKWSCTNIQAIINSVEEGRGIGILSNLLIGEELKKDNLRILEVDDIHITRQIRLIYHKNKYLTSAMNDFIAISRE